MPLANFEVAVEKQEDVAGLTPTQVRKAVAERSEALHTIFEEAGKELDPTKVKAIEVKDGKDLATQIATRNDELSWLGERLIDIDKMEGAKAQADRLHRQSSDHAGKDPDDFAPKGDDDDGQQKGPSQTLGEAFVKSDLYAKAKELSASRQTGITASLELPGFKETTHRSDFLGRKTVFSTTAGWAPESTRTGRVVLDEQREIEITDIFPAFPTSQAAIVYMEETTFTNNAAERNEGAAYAEGALALTERSQTIRSVGVSLPVTDEQLADEGGVSAYLDARLAFMVRQRLDSQLIVGDGNAPNLEGTLNVSNIGSQAKGADSVPDAVYKGMDVVRVTGRAQPNVVLAHPTDWQAVRLLKTTDGIYIWGPPMDAGPARIWGLPVVLSTAVTQNTMIAGDYARFSGLHIKQAVEVMVGFVNDDFLDGRVTIRAGLRAAVVHYRPSAFCEITGV